MVSGPEDEFSNFLDFGDLQLNFPPFDGNNQNGEEIQDGGGPAMEMHANNNAGEAMAFQHAGIQHFTDTSGLSGFDSSSNIFPDLDIPPHLFEQEQQHHPIQQPPAYGQPYIGHNMIPHTPNSIEMHGGKVQYQQTASKNHARAMYEQYRQQSKGQVGHSLDGVN